MPQSTSLGISVAIATRGRAELLSVVLAEIARQTLLPKRAIICPASASDVDVGILVDLPFQVDIVFGGIGLCVQRNVIINYADDEEFIIFFDDDFVPEERYIETALNIMSSNDSIAILTGNVLADGGNGRGYKFDEAKSIISNDKSGFNNHIAPVFNAYGCNMTIRLDVVRANRLKFEEAFPLYGWLEDMDFSRQIAKYGLIARASDCKGVHLGAKSGRASGLQLGYSQIANPAYMLFRKRIGVKKCLNHILRNLIANFTKALFPEPWIDRRGRFVGNVLAIIDMARGQLFPSKISDLTDIKGHLFNKGKELQTPNIE